MEKVVAGFQILMALTATAVFVYLFWTHRQDRKRWRERERLLDEEMEQLKARRDELIAEVEKATLH